MIAFHLPKNFQYKSFIVRSFPIINFNVSTLGMNPIKNAKLHIHMVKVRFSCSMRRIWNVVVGLPFFMLTYLFRLFYGRCYQYFHLHMSVFPFDLLVRVANQPIGMGLFFNTLLPYFFRQQTQPLFMSGVGDWYRRSLSVSSSSSFSFCLHLNMLC